MKRAYTLFAAIILILIGSGCSRKTQLSDEELAQIFHDAFLANAYTSEEGLSLDSLRLYEPIFQSYGYTTEDVQYTIGSFSTRKSARLSDVVERAIKMLEERGVELDKQVEVLESLDDMALKHSTRIIYSDSLLEYRARRDSARMHIVIDDPQIGSYKVTYRVLIDTLDTSTQNYSSKNWLEKDQPLTAAEQKKAKEGDSTKVVKFNPHNTILRRGEVVEFESSFKIDRRADRFILEPLTINKEIRDEKPIYHATVKDLQITLTPKLEQAREDLFMELVGVNIFDDELLFK